MNEKSIKIDMGGESVRFTPDGKVFVEDAIKLMTPEQEAEPHTIWEKIKIEHPDILDYCENYRTGEGEIIPIVNTDGWDKILNLLPGYLFDD